MGRGGEEPAINMCDPGSELRLGRRENRKGENNTGVNGMENIYFEVYIYASREPR